MARAWRLDVLRGLAVLGVILYHCSPAWYRGTFVGWWLARAYDVGWSGVYLFFVLSGFLISGLLFREYARHGSVSVTRFLIRRGFKIYPTYYIWFALMCLGAWIQHDPPTARQVITGLLYLQVYFDANRFPLTWTLCIEEHFYFAMAFAVAWAVARRRPGREPFERLPLAVLLLSVIPLVLRVANVLSHPEITHWTTITPTHLQYDVLLVGVLLGYYFTFQPERLSAFANRWRPVIAAASLALLAIRFWGHLPTLWWYGPGTLLLSWGYGGIVLLVLTTPTPEAERPRPLWAALAWLGRISYSAYLFQNIAISLVLTLSSRATLQGLPAELRAWLLLGFYLTVTMVLSYAAWWLIERPALAIRDRSYPSRSSALARSAVPETPAAA